MEFFRELRELWGNQGMEEEEGVVSVEPIAIIVPSELQDLPKSIMPKSSTNSSTVGGFGNHQSPPSSKSQSSEATPSDDKGVECRLSSNKTRWYYISRREKMMLFTSVKNKVAKWKRQFIFVHDTRMEKNTLLDYVKEDGFVDLEALVTPEQLVTFGFVDTINLYAKDPPHSSSHREQGSNSASRWRSNSRVQSVTTHSFDGPHASESSGAEARSAQTQVSSPKIACPEGFSYTKPKCHTTMLQDMHNFIPSMDWERPKGYMQQNSGRAAMLKLMDVYEDIHRKLLQHRPDFPIGKLTFMEGEEIDEQGKTLFPPFEIIVWLGWKLNKNEVLVFPLIVSEDGEDEDSLPSFKAWVVGTPDVEAEPIRAPNGTQSTLDLSQPTLSPTCSSDVMVVPLVDLTND
ncbi:hypothetical protein SLEP1_g43089 [Rubroshorea leprosula]|uniref:PH domain-containing protein n=1 Tax=Rubroshorea leprosula TaxID=152421 RepID=A0AAV5LC62_9ROSI|nr:hypothetical protein SLEP1_g43089 [Rubroshorea leprosula]